MKPLEYLTDAEVEQHLYEYRMLRWAVIAAGAVIWFLGIVLIFTWAH